MLRAIAITLYDKFEELGILVDIIRHNFSEKYLLAVCSNHPDAEKRIGHLDIDGLRLGQDIFYDPNLPRNVAKPLIRCRSTDSVQTSCKLAIDLGADVVCHVHCDAWPLDETQLLSHFALLTDSRKFTARGLGFGFYGHDSPVGRIDDHFFFFDAPYLKDVGFFDFDPLDMLPHKLSIHGIFGMQILSRVGLRHFYLYDGQDNCEVWPGRKKILPRYPVKPSAYDYKRHFLHVHRQSFPDELGQQLQAVYLRKNGITKGKHIQQFLDRYHIDEVELVTQLEEIDRELSRALRRWGIKPQALAQDFAAMEKALKQAQSKPWIIQFFRNYSRNRWADLMRIRRKKSVHFGYADSLWPDNVNDYYQKMIDKSHFPEQTEFWFES